MMPEDHFSGAGHLKDERKKRLVDYRPLFSYLRKIFHEISWNVIIPVVYNLF